MSTALVLAPTLLSLIRCTDCREPAFALYGNRCDRCLFWRRHWYVAHAWLLRQAARLVECRFTSNSYEYRQLMRACMPTGGEYSRTRSGFEELIGELFFKEDIDAFLETIERKMQWEAKGITVGERTIGGLIYCPICKRRHIDLWPYLEQPHREHYCAYCKAFWSVTVAGI
jgi:hypothetical protein